MVPNADTSDQHTFITPINNSLLLAQNKHSPLWRLPVHSKILCCVQYQGIFPWLILEDLWNCHLYNAFFLTTMLWFNMKTIWIVFSMSCCWTSTKSFSQYPSTCWEELTVGFGVFLRKPFHILLRCRNNFVRKEFVASPTRTFSFFPVKKVEIIKWNFKRANCTLSETSDSAHLPLVI